MARHAELPHEEDVERSVERLGDLERNRDAAPREAENEDVRPHGVAAQLAGKHAAGLTAVAKPLHRGPRVPRGRAGKRAFPSPPPGYARAVGVETDTYATVLVDARNVLRSEWSNILEQRVVELCRQWAGATGVRAVVVFDGAAPGGLVGERALDDRVLLVGTGHEVADDVIARLAAERADRAEPYWLVTSDRELRRRAGAAAERTIGGGTFARVLQGAA